MFSYKVQHEGKLLCTGLFRIVKKALYTTPAAFAKPRPVENSGFRLKFKIALAIKISGFKFYLKNK